MLANFPKSEKFALCQEIKQAYYRVIRNSMIANSMRRGEQRAERFREVDADLKLILVYFGIGRDLKYITEKKALYLQERVSELGRITGGLIKAAQGTLKGQSSLFDAPGQ
jgi:hypothetical protein